MATACTPKGYGTSPPSVTLTTGNCIVVAVGGEGDGYVTAMSWNGQSLTEVPGYALNAGKSYSSFWYLDDITGGTAAPSPTWSATESAPYYAVFELSGDYPFTYDTYGTATGNLQNATVTTLASVTQGDCVCIACLSTENATVTAVAGDADTLYGRQARGGSGGESACGYEVHSSKSGTCSANFTNGRSQSAGIIAVWYPQSTPSPQYVAAGVVSAGAAANAATVSPGSVNVPAGVSSAAAVANAAAVAPGLVNVPAGVEAAGAEAPAAGAKTINYVLAQAAQAVAAALSATVSPGAVNVAAVAAAAALTANAPTASIPSAKTFEVIPKWNGVHNLPAAITINSTQKTPDLRIKGDDATDSDWPCWTYGETLSVAGSGGAVVPNVGSPLLGEYDDSVAGAGGERFDGSSSSIGDLSTKDFKIEVLFRAPSSTGTAQSIIGKRGGSGTPGWLLWMNTGGGLFFSMDTGATQNDFNIGITVNPGAYYFVQIYCDRNEASTSGLRSYMNYAGPMAAADASSYSDVSTSQAFQVGAYNGTTLPWNYGMAVSYAAVYTESGWFAGGASNNTQWLADAMARAGALFGFTPVTAAGTALPTTCTRATASFLEKSDGSLWRVGQHWPRTSWVGGRYCYLPERTFVNRVQYSIKHNTSPWAKNGSVTVTENTSEVTDPLGTNTASLVSGLGQFSSDDLYQSVSGFTASANLSTGVWIRRKSTSGDLRVRSAASSTYGYWVIDLSTLPDAWVRLTEAWDGFFSRTQFTADGSGNAGVLFDCTSGTIDFYLWNVNQGDGYAAPKGVASDVISASAAVSTRQPDVLKYKGDDGNVAAGRGTMMIGVSCPDVTVGASDWYYFGMLSDGGADTLAISLYADGDNSDAAATYVYNSSEQAEVIGTTDICDGTYHVIASSWETNSVKTYCDGSSEGTPDTSASIPSAIDTIDIGRYCTGGYQPVGCGIESFTLYDGVFDDIPDKTASPAVLAAAAVANAATVAPGSVNVPAGVESAAAVAPNATVYQSATYVAAQVVAAAVSALDASVAPGAVQVAAECVAAAAVANAAGVVPGAVNVSAGAVAALAVAMDASVAPGAVQVPAECVAAIAEALAATVSPGPVNVPAECVVAAAAAVNATVNAITNVAAQVAAAAGVANDAAVAPGSVSVPAGLVEAIAAANAATVAPGPVSVPADCPVADAVASNAAVQVGASYVPAVASSAPATAPAATVAAGAVSVPAGVVEAAAAALAATVAPGSVSVPADCPVADAVAPDAIAHAGASYVAAECVVADSVANAATVSPGPVQVVAGVVSAAAEAMAATVVPGAVQIVAGVVSAAAVALDATPVPGAVQVAAECVAAGAEAVAATVAPGAVQVLAGVVSSAASSIAATASAGATAVAAQIVSAAASALSAAAWRLSELCEVVLQSQISTEVVETSKVDTEVSDASDISTEVKP